MGSWIRWVFSSLYSLDYEPKEKIQLVERLFMSPKMWVLAHRPDPIV